MAAAAIEFARLGILNGSVRLDPGETHVIAADAGRCFGGIRLQHALDNDPRPLKRRRDLADAA